MKKINEETIRNACKLLADTLVRKNIDYGSSVEEQYLEHGDTSLIIRLDDKLRRLKQLSTHKANVKTESKADTLLDSAGYSILGYVLLSSEEMETLPVIKYHDTDHQY
jgi:hypothetical protein